MSPAPIFIRRWPLCSCSSVSLAAPAALEQALEMGWKAGAPPEFLVQVQFRRRRRQRRHG
ncbi:MAG: hypothetical protein IPN01_29820 [Deltaproteobacteria bacterium]|nr:hypothetical protein [Deltaproteobacteria bacterium]